MSTTINGLTCENPCRDDTENTSPSSRRAWRGPWCWTNQAAGEWESCGIPACTLMGTLHANVGSCNGTLGVNAFEMTSGFDGEEWTWSECARECLKPHSWNTPTVTCGGNCGCVDGSTASSGYIYFRGSYPYSSNRNCWWLIAAPAGAEISVSFSQFDTQSNYDYVSIYNCSNCEEPSQRILRHSGSLSPSNVYRSTTGFLNVTFTSDAYTEYKGFRAEWSVSGAPVAVAIDGPKHGSCYCHTSCPDLLDCGEDDSMALNGFELPTSCGSGP